MIIYIKVKLHAIGEHRAGWELGRLHPDGAPEWTLRGEPFPSGHLARFLTWKNPEAPLNEPQLQFDPYVWMGMEPWAQKQIWDTASLQNKRILFSELTPKWRAKTLAEHVGLTDTKFTDPTSQNTHDARKELPGSLSDALNGLWQHTNEQSKQTILTNIWSSPELNNLFKQLQTTEHQAWQQALNQPTPQDALNTTFKQLGHNRQDRAHRATILTNAWTPELNDIARQLKASNRQAWQQALNQPTPQDALTAIFEQLDPNNPQDQAHRATMLTHAVQDSLDATGN